MRREVYDPRRSPPKRVPKPDALAVLAEANKDSVDPSLFYDSEEKKRKDREEAEERQRKTELRRKKDRLKQREQNPKDEWVRKYRQQDVFDEVDDEKKEHVRYFCEEMHDEGGKRQYIAADPVDFWREYSQMPVEKRHFYELMRENTPCHLYFDLECSRVANPEVDEARGDVLINHLVDLVREELMHTDEIDATNFDVSEHVIELDSTSETKFSRHIVVRLPDGQMFENNAQCRHFVQKLWRRVESRRDEDERCRALFLKKDTESEDATEPLIDMGVYTRNRVFRLYLSNKYSSGESAPKPRLETTERQRFWKTSKDGEKGEKETFMRSLASLCLDLSPKFIAFEGVTHQSVLRSKEFRGYCTGSYLSPTAAAFNGNAGCPCPRTAAFVCEDFNHWSAHAGAAVRSWTAFPEYGVLTLNLFGNRFCENVERAHKSNNVMFIVDFRESAYYQRCHDPDCRGTRGPWRDLSEDVLDESHALIEMLYEPPTLDDDDEEDIARVPTFDEMAEEDVRAAAAAAL